MECDALYFFLLSLASYAYSLLVQALLLHSTFGRTPLDE